jgi:branched-chain amino acid transport system substrate-binding protein
VLALASTACGTTDDGDDEGSGGDCSGKIAAMGALTGSNASIVLPSVDGAKLALQQFLDENPDCEVELVEFDTQGLPEQATTAAQTIVEDPEFVGVMGGAFSGETDATQETFQAAGIPMVSQSATNPTLTQDDPVDVFHRVIAHDLVQGGAIANFLNDSVSAESVFVIRDDSTYGAALGQIVEDELGDKVVGTDEVKTGQTEFSATVNGVEQADPEWVFYAGYTAEAAPLAKQLKDSGVRATFLAGDGVYGSQFPDAAGNGAEGAVITCPCLPASEVEGSFEEDFTAEFGAPGAYAAEGYDAMNIFLQGLLEGNTDRASMLEWVNNYDDAGLTKQISFDENGDVPIESVVVWAYTVEGGQIVPLEEVPVS